MSPLEIQERPCAGVTAGGMCDRMCFCQDEGDEPDDDA